MKPIEKPDAENPHVWFDKRGSETGRISIRLRYSAHPQLNLVFGSWSVDSEHAVKGSAGRG